MNTTPPLADAAPRLLFLDWLRILALMLLVPFHVGMYYVSWPWHVKSVHAGPWLEPWMRLSSPWRMSLLFLVSGAALSLALRHKTANRSWVRARARKLMLPLLAGVLLLVPLQPYFEVRQFHGYGGSYIDFMGLYLTGYGGFCQPGRGCLILPTWNHLWYLPYLMAYTVVLAGLLRWRPALLDTLAQRLAPWLPARWAWLWPMAWLLATLAALRPLFPPSHALVDDLYLHSQYLPLFVLGAVLARLPQAWARAQALRWPALGLAALGWAVLVGVPGTLAMGVSYSLMQWCALVAALGFAHRHLNTDGPWRRQLSDAVFPLYLVHQSATIALAMALAPLQLRPALEGPLLVAGTLLLGAGAALLARQVAWLRPWLGGTLAAATLAAVPATASANPALAGEWWTPGFGARVRLAPCGDAWCGHIVWLWEEDAEAAAGRPPLLGRTVVRGMRPQGPGKLAGGQLHNPEDGHDYRGSLELRPDGRLLAQGCVLMVCRTQTWRRHEPLREPPVAGPK